MDLSIIIVNYNTRELLHTALETIRKNPPATAYEIFVVDNASTDGSKEYLKETANGINIILNEQNIGYSAANNIAIRKSKGRYILLLNPDTEVLEGTLTKCITFMDTQPEIGILGCKVMLPDGQLDLACRRGFPNIKNAFFKFTGLANMFPKSKYFAGYNLTYLDENESYPVDSVVGAFMMLRQETIAEIGLLDETFFMYGEDIDWCYRAKESRWTVYYYAEAEIIHHKRASSKSSRKALIAFYQSMTLFYKKHYAKKHNFLVNTIVYMAISIMGKIKILLNEYKK